VALGSLNGTFRLLKPTLEANKNNSNIGGSLIEMRMDQPIVQLAYGCFLDRFELKLIDGAHGRKDPPMFSPFCILKVWSFCR
jgi:hypothetical protein